MMVIVMMFMMVMVVMVLVDKVWMMVMVVAASLFCPKSRWYDYDGDDDDIFLIPGGYMSPGVNKKPLSW